ncbi:TIGR03885 family FMN-dependent LLM class oxidoreductase, partial [Roseicyclus sp.]|uniref:TIGR03885 family FMN-dependent LLM class oxidoreductase n=1 Tax=Roseicyclus sp. TaxID=1914329 RepID=UPI003F9FA622
MAIIGFHASHEQIGPRALLEDVQRAEAAGFEAAMSSDHFSPWSARQGESGFAWSWLGAALEATSLPFGVVNAPGQRYHPAIIAQAAATLSAMNPGRFWMALGTGEASNEHITGDPWPEKSIRTARLEECVAIMRALFAGETVSHSGLVTVDRAKLWTLPETPPPMIGAAVSVETARRVGGWADGLITVNQSQEHLARMIAAFRENGGAGKPLYLQVHVAYADDEETALDIAHDQWRSNVFAPPVCWDLELPAHFDEASRFVRREDMHGSVLVSSDPERFV